MVLILLICCRILKLFYIQHNTDLAAMKYFKLLLIQWVIGLQLSAQIPDRPNLYDADSLRIGDWILYYDSLDNKVAKDSAFVYCLLSFERGVPNQKMECFYTNGIKQWQGKMQSTDPDIKHGGAIFYYPLGNIQAKVNFKNNLLSGDYKGYYENGQVQYMGIMKNDKNTGYWEYFHENGKLMSKGNFVEGVQDGYWEFYLDTGQPQTKGNIEKGKYNGEWIVYHSNGKISDISNFIDNIKTGKAKSFFENGQLASSGSYSNNLMDGDFSFYHTNGQLESNGKVRDGLYQGPWDFYYSNGNLASNRVYVDDKENGYFKYFYEDGTLKSEGNVNNDVWNGIVTFYNPNGAVKSKGEIVNGLYQGPWIFNYESGKRKINRSYKDDKEDGLWEFFAENGTQTEKGIMKSGLKEGLWEFHHINGQLSYKGTYKEDLKNGFFEYYREDGTPMRNGKYYGEIKEGPFEYYSDNGLLKSKGEYENDKRIGHWAFYHDNGNLSTEGLYVDGKSEGNWKYYYPDGVLKKEGDEHLDKTDGYWKYYFETGVLKSEGENRLGKREGLWKYYHENGKLNSSGQTRKDEAYGVWKFYDSLGRKTSEGKWKDNLKDSIWVYYDTLGRKREVGVFAKNKAYGKWWIYKNGKKDHKEYWNHGTELNFWNLRDSSENVALRHEDELAFKIAKAAKKQWKKTYKRGEKNYHSYWRMMGTINRYTGRFHEAERQYLKASLEAKRAESDTSWNYAISQSDLAINYYALGLYQKSVDRYEVALDAVSKSESGKADDNYFQIMSQLAKAYMYNNQPIKAVSLIHEDLVYRTTNHPSQKENIAIGYGKLGELYYRSSKYDSAISTYTRLYDYLNENDIRGHYIESDAYRHNAYAFGAISNVDSAIHYFNEAIKCHKRQNSITSEAFVMNYTGLADKYYGLNKHILSNQYADSAVYLSEQNNLKGFSMYYDALLAKARASARLYQYQLAVDYYLKAEKSIKSKVQINNRDLSSCYQGLALAYEDLFPENYDLAESYYKKAIEIFQSPSTFKSNYVNGSLLLAGFYRERRMYDKSFDVLITLRNYYEKLDNRDTYYYGRMYQEFGKLNYTQYQYDSAFINYKKALSFFGDQENYDVFNYANVLDDMADIHESLDQYDEAQKLILEALSILEERLGKDHDSYIGQLHALAVHHRKRRNYPTAIAMMKQVLESKNRSYGTKNSTFTDAQYTLLITYRQNKQYQLALEVAERMKNNILSISDKLSEDYINYVEAVGSIYSDLENYSEAKKFFEEMVSLSRSFYGPKHEDYAYSLREAGRFYRNFEKYEKALVYLESAVDIIASAQGTQNQKYAWSLETLGDIYYSMENYKGALSAKEQIIDIYKNVYGSDSEHHIDAISSLANLYYSLGRFADAESMYSEALDLIMKSRGIYNTYYAQLLEDISLMYRWWEKPAKAIEQAQMAIQLLDSLEDTHPTRYFGLYNALGLALQDLGRYDESETYLTKARQGALKNWGKAPAYFTYTNNLAFAFMLRGEFQIAEELFLEAGSRFNNYEVVNDLERVNYEDNLATLYLAWNKMDLAEKYWTSVTGTLLKRINSNFSYMSEGEKSNFWDAYKKDFEYFNSYVLKASDNNSRAIGQMYDNQLQTKSILLSSSTKERTKIINSGDSQLINKYFEYIDLKENLAKYYGYTNEQLKAENIEIDSIESLANNYEKDLSINANALEDEERAKSVRWKDIQRKLKDNEAAVEMIRFRYFDKHVTDSVIYAALVLTSDTRKNPELVILPNGSQLETKYLKNYLTSVKFKVEDRYSYDQFWKKIDSKLEGKSIVYFSPDGVYNQLNVNTLIRPNDNYIIDDYNVHILTSSKDILLLDKRLKKSLDNQVATLFGFPKYDLAHSSIENIVQERSLERSRNLERDVDLTRFGFSELPGTKAETQSIADILINNQWQTDLYLADEALEEILKSVNSPNVLHIATHGFFLDDIEGDQLQLGVRAERSRKNPLLRSGLLLAGAAQTVQGDYDNKTENGIFTAYEAMNLDLRDTDLVVLSACETGRGEVKSGEGVYGLQRAFQVAGAESLIMSLWKVNDDATQLLMTNFYKNWISGISKNEAFKKAQIAVREQFSEPYYWGAFVMVGK